MQEELHPFASGDDKKDNEHFKTVKKRLHP